MTHISEWEQIGRAHGEVFSKIRPATAMVEVSRLVNPDMLVEIEAEAIVTNSKGSRGATGKTYAARRPKAVGKRKRK